jgi:hypothetical protein
MLKQTLLFLSLITFLCCSQSGFKTSEKSNPAEIKKGLSDEELPDLVEKQTFQYFWDRAEPTSEAAENAFMQIIFTPKTIKIQLQHMA